MKRLVSVAVVALALAACSGDRRAPAESRLDPGPMVQPGWHKRAATIDEGLFTDGAETLLLPDGLTGTLVDVDLVGSSGLELVGFGVADSTRNYSSVDIMPSWPPVTSDIAADAIHLDQPLLIEAGRGSELLIGMRATRLGLVTRRAVDVTYEVGGVRYRVRFPAAWRIRVTS